MLCILLPSLLWTVNMTTELKNYSVNKHLPELEHKSNARLDTAISHTFERSEVKAKQDQELVETDAVQDKQTYEGSKSRTNKLKF